MLKLSEIRPLVKEWKKNKTSSYFSDYRLYIPLLNKNEILRSTKLGSKSLQSHLKKKGFFIYNYDIGIAKQYRKNRFMKIGKLIKENVRLKKAFDNDPKRDLSRKARDKKLCVVISRHPYDIIGASTRRNWTSCMNLANGDYSYQIRTEIKQGSLIAYLIYDNDKNIQNPLARIMLRPHKSLLTRKINLIPGPSYGIFHNNFKLTVQLWLKNINHLNPGFYELMPGCFSESIFFLQVFKNNVIIPTPINTLKEWTSKIEELITKKPKEIIYADICAQINIALNLIICEYDEYEESYFNITNKKTLRNNIFDKSSYEEIDNFWNVCNKVHTRATKSTPFWRSHFKTVFEEMDENLDHINSKYLEDETDTFYEI